MARNRYRIDAARSRVIVTARSNVHDTEAKWDKMSGHIEVDPAAVADGATAAIDVDMTSFDAGDWLKNRKLKKDLDVAKHPTASFELTELSDLKEQDDRTIAQASGVIRWRGREATIAATGHATVGDREISARASFDLNVRDLGVTPPKILMLKVEEIVSITVELTAVRS